MSMYTMCLVLALRRLGLLFFFFFPSFNIEDSWQVFIPVAVLGLHFVFPSYPAAPCNTCPTTTTLGFVPREGKPDEGDSLFIAPQLGTRLQFQLGWADKEKRVDSKGEMALEITCHVIRHTWINSYRSHLNFPSSLQAGACFPSLNGRPLPSAGGEAFSAIPKISLGADLPLRLLTLAEKNLYVCTICWWPRICLPPAFVPVSAGKIKSHFPYPISK